MAFSKKTWKDRQGTGLDKFTINGETVTLTSQPWGIEEQGDKANATTFNDLETRIYNAFNNTDTLIQGEANARANEDARIKSVLVGSFFTVRTYSLPVSGYAGDVEVGLSGYIARAVTNVALASENTSSLEWYRILRGAYLQNSHSVRATFGGNVSLTLSVTVLYTKSEV